MDDRDNLFSVSGMSNSTDGNDAEPQTAQSESVPDSTDSSDGSNANVQYDEFMFQPIGFEELDKQKQEEEKAIATAREKRRINRNERVIILLLVLIFLVAFGLSVFAIVNEVSKSEKVFANYKKTENVVLYRESKPESDDMDDSYIDADTGKYTTEGIASVVRPSIVEIYAYDDSRHTTMVGSGSGVIISEDGYIVTNTHVLDADGYHTVTTADDKVYDAKIIGRDSKTDIAILKISAPDLKPAVLGDSDEIVPGEQVMAIGNPAGLSGSVTDGIVSAVNRKIKSDSTGFEMNCIQTNADISPGNSGGALVNMYGQVIGITSSKYVSSSYEGLGFAITINDAVPIIEELINQGYVGGRFRIGIQLIDMENEYKKASIEETIGFELPDDFKGIYIAEISEDSDIINTELEPGDFITAINGKSISTYDEFYDTISSMYGAGDYVPATCARFEDGESEPEYFEIEFMLLEDTSGDY